MHRLLILSLLFVCSLRVQAQGLNTGLRANAGYRIIHKNNYGKEIDSRNFRLMIAPELFLRYETRGKCALELSYNQSRSERTVAFPFDYDNQSDTVNTQYKYQDVTLAGQCRLSNTQFPEGKVFRGIQTFFGVSLGVMIVDQEVQSTKFTQLGISGSLLNAQYVGLWTGVNFSVNADLGKRFKMVSGAYFKFDPGLQVFGEKSNASNLTGIFGLQLGAAYRIF